RAPREGPRRPRRCPAAPPPPSPPGRNDAPAPRPPAAGARRRGAAAPPPPRRPPGPPPRRAPPPPRAPPPAPPRRRRGRAGRAGDAHSRPQVHQALIPLVRPGVAPGKRGPRHRPGQAVVVEHARRVGGEEAPQHPAHVGVHHRGPLPVGEADDGGGGVGPDP